MLPRLLELRGEIRGLTCSIPGWASNQIMKLNDNGKILLIILIIWIMVFWREHTIKGIQASLEQVKANEQIIQNELIKLREAMESK